MANMRGGGAGALCSLWFGAQRDLREHRRKARRRLELELFDALLAIAALQQQAEVREPARLVGRGAGDQRRAERQRRWGAGSATGAGGDREARARGEVRDERAAPRVENGVGGVGPALRRRVQRGLRAAREGQLEDGERQLRGALE